MTAKELFFSKIVHVCVHVWCVCMVCVCGGVYIHAPYLHIPFCTYPWSSGFSCVVRMQIELEARCSEVVTSLLESAHGG